MLYQRPTFTCPAAPPKTSQRQWDLAMLSREEFKHKYKISDRFYDQLASSRNTLASSRD